MKKADKIRGWSICESCLRNAGGCSWTEEDPVTHRIRFEPVPGWTAQPTTIPWSRKRVESYFVADCPKQPISIFFGHTRASPLWMYHRMFWNKRRQSLTRRGQLDKSGTGGMESN